MSAREGEVYTQPYEFFGGESVWQNFSTWLGQIPAVSYGIFTNEVDSAVVAQLPAIDGGGSVDEALAAIEAEVAAQIQ